jgi:prepilin-type N-terminal cleavage/methylation domain-containing protein
MKSKHLIAFTLIELLVVIAIVGILSGFVLVSLNSATNAANDARRKSDLSQIVKALLVYNTSNPTYPIETCAIGSTCSETVNNALGSASSITGPNNTYYTYSSDDGTSFTVSTILSDTDTYSYNPETGYTKTQEIEYISTCISEGGLTCTETTDGSYIIYSFTYSSAPGSLTWTVPSGVSSLEYLVVAGGGGGGARHGGGGGAGGLLTATDFSVVAETEHSIAVGAGGAGDANTSSSCHRGGNGGNSIFSTIIATGGGAGGGGDTCAGAAGGSGGGAADRFAAAGGTGIVGQGYNGGTTPAEFRGSGGGGAGEAGHVSPSQGTAAPGGNGIQSSITGSAIYYAGGGGAGMADSLGGLGGGGRGHMSTAKGENGVNGLGGGGGATDENLSLPGGNGGSGVVILRFLHP